MKILRSPLLILMVVFIGCKKRENPQEKVSSEVTTLSISSPDPVTLLLKAQIAKGDYQISSYGFIYGTAPGLTKENATVVTVGTSFTSGVFVKEIGNLSISNSGNKLIYGRAFFVDENKTVYGNEMSTEMPVFQAGVVNPMKGQVGDEIKITGKFYSPAKGDISVTFSDVQANVISVSDAEIRVSVPKGIPKLHGQSSVVKLINKNVKTELTKDFRILAHITDFIQKEGAIGSILHFVGDNFENGAYAPVDVPIYFNNKQGEFNFSDKFGIVVPMNIPVTSSIYVSIDGVKTKLPGEFTLLEPVIENITPKSGIPGTVFKLTGKNIPFPFHEVLSGVFGSSDVGEITSSENRLSFRSPLDVDPGEQTISIKAGPFTVVSPKITVLPWHLEVSPKSAYIFSSVKVGGTLLPDILYSVSLNDTVQTDLQVEGDGSGFRFHLWDNIGEGDVPVFLLAGKKKIPAGAIKILFPKIASIIPSSAQPGNQVLVKAMGDDFYLGHSGPRIYIGDVLVPKTYVKDQTSSFLLTIPPDIKPGKTKIIIRFPAYDVVSPEFEVL